MESISFKLEVFEGPLDLLLSLIAKHKLNICDIEISKLLEQYLRRGANMDPRGMVSFLCRPVSLIFIVIAVISVFWSLFGDKIRKPSKEAQAIDQAIKSKDEDY